MLQCDRFLTLIFLALLCCRPHASSAQLEVHPYGAIALGEQKYSRSALIDGELVNYPEPKYGLGVDVHVGSRQLAPLFGAVYGSRESNAVGISYQFTRFSLPLGLAYRLRHPDTSFNLVAHGAFVPSLERFSAGDPSAKTSEIVYGARGGLLLYLDFITVGVDYYFGSPDGQFVLRLGGRF